MYFGREATPDASHQHRLEVIDQAQRETLQNVTNPQSIGTSCRDVRTNGSDSESQRATCAEFATHKLGSGIERAQTSLYSHTTHERQIGPDKQQKTWLA
jgi:hypothetical protein